MRFSLNFIKEFLKVKVSPQKLSSLLTLAGMEVEQCQKAGGDWVFDIEVTPNRYDWLAHIGIAREIAACLNKQLKIAYPKIRRKPPLKERKIIIEDYADCPFYIGRAAANISVCSSPSWLKERVVNCGINSVNNIVDITNYCMLKWGNPLHAFDEDKLEGDIYIRRAKEEEPFIGIDNKERILTNDNLVIADEKKVIALAGVMGAKNTEVSRTTKNIFLEAAIFSPLVVRRSRRAAGVDTESAYRFERRVHPDYLEYASQEAASLIEKIGGGRLRGYEEAGSKPAVKEKRITINFGDLNSYLGEDLPCGEVKNILKSCGFKIIRASKNKIYLLSPRFRFDIQREVDVYEEAARFYGYGKIEPRLPSLGPHLKEEQEHDFKNELRRLLSTLGLKEIITYSIETEGDLNILGERNCIEILNPLRKDESKLRPNLVLGMIKALRYNFNRGQKNLHFFEIANVYKRTKNNFDEFPRLSLGSSSGIDNFFYLKGVAEEILRYLGRGDFEFKEGEESDFASCANGLLGSFTNYLKITAAGYTLGFMGKLNEHLRRHFDLREDLFFCQLDINLLKNIKREKIYKPFSLYPAVGRDISIALGEKKRFEELRGIILREAGLLLSDMRIADVYRGKDIPLGYSAFTLRIFYQSRERTLTSQEIDALHGKIRERLANEEGVILR